ncbi:hypothetical protein QVD17_19704 [Tagetes erecta]|uniref:Uncharacterized protein n=1 Tax=Tagetes erecta TaxID=13708 RepID=A0AAD8KRF8_TARER|nr:hypothetical protein QVD17_19704 [Tagetes erecta]
MVVRCWIVVFQEFEVGDRVIRVQICDSIFANRFSTPIFRTVTVVVLDNNIKPLRFLFTRDTFKDSWEFMTHAFWFVASSVCFTVGLESSCASNFSASSPCTNLYTRSNGWDKYVGVGCRGDRKGGDRAVFYDSSRMLLGPTLTNGHNTSFNILGLYHETSEYLPRILYKFQQ